MGYVTVGNCPIQCLKPKILAHLKLWLLRLTFYSTMQSMMKMRVLMLIDFVLY